MDMTPNEMRAILDRLGWSQVELAERIGRNQRGIRSQAAGRAPIDKPLADWLRALDHAWAPFAALLDNPPPNTLRGERDADISPDLGTGATAAGHRL